MLEGLRWRTNASASCLHAAACRWAGLAAANAEFERAIASPADALIGEISGAGWQVDQVLDELTSLAAEIDNNRELVDRLISRRRLQVVEAEVPVCVAGAIADLEAAMRRWQPQIEEELAARVRPLREQWEARGPGMLQEVGRLTQPEVVPAAAEVILVLPYAGGRGVAHPAQNRVTLEAVLVNPLPALPEAVRLAWLLSQLNAEMPWLTDVVPPVRAAAAMRLAMIPPVLAAAEAVELTHCDEASIAGAIHAWLPNIDAESAAPKMWSWWNAWMEHPTRWPVAVAALEQLVRS
jgi:hypothetical protein